MKKALEVTLGIVTSIGGFLDVGAIATTAQAGAIYGFQLEWAIALGTICLMFLVEMSGRLPAVSRHPIRAAVRERFGFTLYVWTMLADTAVNVLVLAAEIGGVCLAIQLLTGIGFPWWALPVGFLVWLLLWRGTFGLIEDGIAILGLITLVFVAGAWRLGPPLQAVAAGFLPSLPEQDPYRYWFIAVSILGALISPYMLFFYSSGAIEDRWDESHLHANRAIAVLGMGFGATVSLGVMITAAMVFLPRGIQVDQYEQAALMLTVPFGYWGFVLFAVSLAIACYGAALELSLSVAYSVAQGLGWNWGESLRARKNARFSLSYTALIVVSTLVIATGVDPLSLTIFSMAATALVLPLVLGPFLVLMNDENYVGEHRNGRLGNVVVVFTVLLSFVLAVITIPLEILGG
jgi:Mn2+/Fe2+ NRAMP family transporter